ncbi:LysR substrate-binding domain-containing protein [Mesorhizobium sp. M0482]|uniref:LysR family transcriptional regulator n=1 Tax=Mesorhizobium sp. M0482 TaxID=2956948 RepID=UPI00333DE433
MELRQLRYFLIITESGALSKASSIIGVAQPALSRQIRQLEEELGVQLFYRHGRGIRVTEEGAQFYAAIVPVLRELDQVKSDLVAAAKVPAGDIVFGMPPSMSAAIGAEIVSDFFAHFPQVKLHLVDGLSGFINEWLASGRVDMAIINNARKAPYMRMDPLLEVDLLLFGRRKDIDAIAPDTETFQTPALVGLPLLLVGRNHGLRRELDSAMQRLGLELDIKAEVDALAPLKKLVRDGHGLTVLPHGVINFEVSNPEFSFRKLVEPNLTQRFMLAFSLQRPTTLAMRELARRVRIELRKAVEDGRMVGRLSKSQSPMMAAAITKRHS